MRYSAGRIDAIQKNLHVRLGSSTSLPKMSAYAGNGLFMDVISLVGIVAALFIVISLSEPLADRSRLPYTVVLAIIGTLIGLGAVFLVDHGRDFLGLPLAVEMFEINIRA